MGGRLNTENRRAKKEGAHQQQNHPGLASGLRRDTGVFLCARCAAPAGFTGDKGRKGCAAAAAAAAAAAG